MLTVGIACAAIFRAYTHPEHAALRSKAPGDTLTLTYTDPSGLIETVQVTLGTQ